MAAGPPLTWELSSLIMVATNPQPTPAAIPSKAARRPGDAARPPRAPDAAIASDTTASVAPAASHHEAAGACACPPDGDAAARKMATPADMATAGSHSRGPTRPGWAAAR